MASEPGKLDIIKPVESLSNGLDAVAGKIENLSKNRVLQAGREAWKNVFGDSPVEWRQIAREPWKLGPLAWGFFKELLKIKKDTKEAVQDTEDNLGDVVDKVSEDDLSKSFAEIIEEASHELVKSTCTKEKKR